jgi:hypothetical protein
MLSPIPISCFFQEMTESLLFDRCTPPTSSAAPTATGASILKSITLFPLHHHYIVCLLAEAGHIARMQVCRRAVIAASRGCVSFRPSRSSRVQTATLISTKSAVRNFSSLRTRWGSMQRVSVSGATVKSSNVSCTLCSDLSAARFSS